MPLVEYVRLEEAEDDVRELLEESYRKHHKRSLLMEALANHPPLLEAHRTYSELTLLTGNVDRELKELVSVAVSQVNECDYCMATHRENLVEVVGLEEERVREIADWELDSLTERKRVAVEFAKRAATNPKRITDGDIDELVEAGFDERDVVELLGVIGLIVSSNLYMDVLSVDSADRDEVLAEYGDVSKPGE